MPRLRILISVLSVAITAGQAVLAEQPAALQSLRRTRRSLLDQLAEMRPQPGDGRYCLLLPGAAEGFDMRLTLSRRQGTMQSAWAVVPWWQQETQKEKFSFLYRDGGQGLRRDKFFSPASATGLQLQGDRLTGSIVVRHKLDLPAERRMPPGGRHLYTTDGRWSLLDQWYLGSRTIPRRQRIDLDARVRSDMHRIDLVLQGGIDSRPLLISATIPAGPWQDTTVKAPTWNAGVHQADADGLRYADGRLTGTLRVKFNPDAWFPKSTWYATYKLDITVQHGRAGGTFSATISEGDYVKVTGQNKQGTRPGRDGPVAFSGRVTGRVMPAVTGTYVSTGPLGDRTGLVRGGRLPYPDAPARLLNEPEGTPIQQATTLYNQIRALRMVLDAPGRALPDMLALTDWPAPTVAGGNHLTKVHLAILRDLAGQSPTAPMPTASNPHFGPFFDSQTLGATDRIHQLPGQIPATGPQQWRWIKHWRVLGPLSSRPTLPGPPSRLPPVIVLPEAGSLPAEIDRLGDRYQGPRQLRWQSLDAAPDGTLQPPCWSWNKKGKTGQPGRSHATWMAHALVRAESNGPVWLAVEARDEAVVWVNGTFVRALAPVQRNFRKPGPTVVQIPLHKGTNDLLVWVRDDRAESFARLAVCTAGADASSLKPAPVVKPELAETPADPPLAWDIQKGVNVAWTAEVVSAEAEPIVVGDRIYQSARPHHLLCLDAASGKQLWRAGANVLESIDPKAAHALKAATADQQRQQIEKHLGKEFARSGLDASTPVRLKGRTVVHFGTGVLACFDDAGRRLWMVRTHMPDASLRVIDDRVIVEGAPTDAWAKAFGVEAADLSTRKQGRAGHNYGRSENHTKRRLKKLRDGTQHGLMALNADGKTLWVRAANGLYAGGPLVLDVPDASGKTRPVLVTRGAEAYDPADGKRLRDWIDLGFWDWLAATASGNRIYSAWEGGRGGAVFWRTPAGLGVRRLFRADRLNAYVAGGANDAISDGQYVYVWRRVWEHAKHCPAYALQLDVFDAESGRRIDWIKPAIRSTNRAARPVRIGGYLYLPETRGGPHSGGTPVQRQITVTTAGPRPVLLAHNPTPHYSAGPVAIGDDLLIRCGDRLHRISLDDAGRAYQRQTVARTVLSRIYDKTPDPPAAQVEPLAEIPNGPSPVAPISAEQGLDDWLVAGPFPAEAAGPGHALPQPGSKLKLAGAAQPLRALPDKLISQKTRFFNDGRLDDWQIRKTVRRLDLSGLSDRGGEVFYLGCLLHNDRKRLAYSTMDAAGLTVYLAGREIAPGRPVELAPGYYPLWVRVEPDRFRRRRPLPPVSVTNALQADALAGVDWPETWTVFGPIPEASGKPDADQLKQIPETLQLGPNRWPALALPTIGRSLDLTAIIDLQDGAKPRITEKVQSRPVNQSLSAWAMAEIEIPAGGYLVVNAAADWFMEWYLDGRRVYSTLSKGNGRNPLQLDAHSFAAPVDKGKHVLAVRIKPGSKGWSLTSLGGLAAGDPSDLAKRFAARNGLRAGEPEWRVQLAFDQIDHPDRVEQVRLRQVRRAVDLLRRIAGESPNSPEARRALNLLEKLDAAEPSDRIP